LMPGRPMVVGREMTKLHEEFLRGKASAIAEALAARPAIKGEMTLVIGKAVEAEPDGRPARELMDGYLERGMSRMDAIKEIARARGVPKREIYAELEKE